MSCYCEPKKDYISQKIILKTKAVKEAQNPQRFQFTRTAIESHFKAGINIIICGHAHKEEKQQLNKHVFYALPAWEDNKGYYLLFNKGAFDLYEFNP